VWVNFYESALVHHKASVNHGSSGKCRVAQHHDISRESNSWFMQQIANTVTLRDKSVLLNKSDTMQLHMSKSLEFLAVESMLNYVRDTARIDAESPYTFVPTVAK